MQRYIYSHHLSPRSISDITKHKALQSIKPTHKRKCNQPGQGYQFIPTSTPPSHSLHPPTQSSIRRNPTSQNRFNTSLVSSPLYESVTPRRPPLISPPPTPPSIPSTPSPPPSPPPSRPPPWPQPNPTPAPTSPRPPPPDSTYPSSSPPNSASRSSRAAA